MTIEAMNMEASGKPLEELTMKLKTPSRLCVRNWSV